MVQFNFAEKTIKAKVVYYGPAKSGKTTNLEQIHRLTDPTGHNPYARMTLTYSSIARGRLVVFTVAGEDKRAAFAGVRAGETRYPASRVQADRVVWLVDHAAAGE